MDTISANVIIIVPFVGFMSYYAMPMLSIETWVCDENLEEKQKFYGDRGATLIPPPDAWFSPSHQVSPLPATAPLWIGRAQLEPDCPRLNSMELDGSGWCHILQPVS